MIRRTFLAAAAAMLSAALAERLPVLRGFAPVPTPAPVPGTPLLDAARGVKITELTIETSAGPLDGGWLAGRTSWWGRAQVCDPEIAEALREALLTGERLPLEVPSLGGSRVYRGEVLITAVEGLVPTPTTPITVEFHGYDALVVVAKD
jgi:hypothetical protein